MTDIVDRAAAIEAARASLAGSRAVEGTAGHCIVIAGESGLGCTQALREVAASTHGVTLWLRATAQGLKIVRTAGVGAETASLHGLDELGPYLSDAGDTEGRATLLCDDVHALSESDSHALGDWLNIWCLAGHNAAMAFHRTGSSQYTADFIADLPVTQRIDLLRLEDDETWHVVTDGIDGDLLTWREEILDVCGGFPSRAATLRRELISRMNAGTLDQEAFDSAASATMRQCTARAIRTHSSRARTGALLASLIIPEGSPEDACALLNTPPSVAQRHLAFFEALGIHPGDEVSCRRVRDALIETMVSDEVEPVLEAALTFLRRTGAAPARILDIVSMSSEAGDKYHDAAVQAYRHHIANAHFGPARAVAETTLRRTTTGPSVAWATKASLHAAILGDWSGVEDLLQRQDCRSDIAAVLLSGEFDVLELSLEHPSLTGVLADGIAANPDGPLPSHLLEALTLSGRQVPDTVRARLLVDKQPHSVRAARIVLRCLQGRPAEDLLTRLDDDLTIYGSPLDVSVATATLMALGHMLMHNLERSRDWVAIASMASHGKHLAYAGIGHLVDSHSRLRTGDFAGAARAATEAEACFGRRGARRLRMVARAAKVHAHCEDTSYTGPLTPIETLPGTLPVLSAYVDYVEARRALREDRPADALPRLFGVGRSLSQIKIKHPVVMHWRPQLIALLQADGQQRFADLVADDFIAALKTWKVHNPRTAALHAHLAGDRAGEVTGDPSAAQSTNADAEPELSPAEARVVRLVIAGLGNREVAAHLYLSKRTVDKHLSNVYRKLGVHSRHELVAFYASSGAGVDGKASKPVWG